VRPVAEAAFERVLGDLGMSDEQRERTLALGLLLVGETSVADLEGQVRLLGERMFAALDRVLDQHRREARIGPVIEAVQHLAKKTWPLSPGASS
jgi:hypothetical protein